VIDRKKIHDIDADAGTRKAGAGASAEIADAEIEIVGIFIDTKACDLGLEGYTNMAAAEGDKFQPRFLR
jgi:hypothetical protein